MFAPLFQLGMTVKALIEKYSTTLAACQPMCQLGTRRLCIKDVFQHLSSIAAPEKRAPHPQPSMSPSVWTFDQHYKRWLESVGQRVYPHSSQFCLCAYRYKPNLLNLGTYVRFVRFVMISQRSTCLIRSHAWVVLSSGNVQKQNCFV